jgi:hypothetical protein
MTRLKSYTMKRTVLFVEDDEIVLHSIKKEVPG